jgi:hypothetical protein
MCGDIRGVDTSRTRRASEGTLERATLDCKVQVREVPRQVYECCLHRTQAYLGRNQT